MADISKVKLPNDSTIYNISDSTARAAINALPKPMIFKGTLGIGGSIQVLPTPSSANEGFTYKVITAGTYASQVAKVGDVFISNGSAWVLIPAGDEDTDTWRNLSVNNTSWLSNGISSGGANFIAGDNITLTPNGNNLTIASSGGSGGMPLVPGAIENNIATFNNEGAVKDSGLGTQDVDSIELTEVNTMGIDTIITSSSTNDTLPTSKAVYDLLHSLELRINALENQ